MAEKTAEGKRIIFLLSCFYYSLNRSIAPEIDVSKTKEAILQEIKTLPPGHIMLIYSAARHETATKFMRTAKLSQDLVSIVSNATIGKTGETKQYNVVVERRSSFVETIIGIRGIGLGGSFPQPSVPDDGIIVYKGPPEGFTTLRK